MDGLWMDAHFHIYPHTDFMNGPLRQKTKVA